MAAEKKPIKPSPDRIPAEKEVPVREHGRPTPGVKTRIEPPQPWPRKD